MTIYSYERYLQQPTKRKIAHFAANDRLRHVIFSQQLTPTILDSVCTIATMIRHLDESADTARFLNSLLSHKRAMLYFTQASTRTFSSFEAACHLLGMKTSEVRDPSLSSEYKGETPIDSMRMYSSYNHVVIMRTREPNFAERCAYMMNELAQHNRRNIPIVNAGSGADEHPTQALLDIYTIRRAFSFTSDRDSQNWTYLQDLQRKYPNIRTGLHGKTYTFSGDIGRGRTVRSLAVLLAQYPDVTMQFVSPDHEILRLQPDLRDRLIGAGVKVSEHTDLSEVVSDTDLLYMTRVQAEYDAAGDRASLETAIQESRCKLTVNLAHQMRSYAPIMHPFPRVDEIPTAIDDDPRALYFEQAANGMYVRAALLAHLFDVDGDIRLRYEDEMSDYHSYNLGALKA